MAKRKSARKSKAGCGCPAGAKRFSTKGRGRGFACLKNGKFVKAVGC